MILFLIVTIISSSLSYGINKCCPDGKFLNNNGVCINSKSDNNEKFQASLVAAGQEITSHQFPICSGKENTEYAYKYENNGDGSISLNAKRVRKWYEYCVDYMLRNNVLEEKIIACNEKVELEFKCGKGPCVFKCCEKGSYFDGGGNCKKSENAIDWKFNSSQEAIIGEYKIIYGFPRCSSHSIQNFDQYTLNSDRSISFNVERVIKQDEYCQDYMLKKNKILKKMIICSDEEEIREICQKKRCIFKCCDRLSNLNEDLHCISFLKLYEWKFSPPQEAIIGKYRIVHGFAKCSWPFVEEIYKYDLNSNGSISLSDNRVFNWNEYCVDYKQVPRDGYYFGKKVLGCRQNEFITNIVCTREVCIFKCCDNGKYLDNTGSCIDSGNSPDWEFSRTQETKLDAYRLFSKFPNCDRKNIEYVDKYELYKNGTIKLTTTNRVINRFGYCGDYTLENNKLVEKIIICKE